MRKLPTVPVDATAIGAGHLIPVDGIVAKVISVTGAGPGRLRILYRPADDENAPAAGILSIRDDHDVLCVRIADWLASRNGGDSRG